MHLLKRSSVPATFLIAVVMAGCGSSGSASSGVSAATYVKSICGAVGPFEKDVQTRSSALALTRLNGASQGKRALHGFLSAVASHTDRTLSQIKAAGTPSVSNGKAIAAALVSAFTQLRTTMHQAVSQAGSLPTGSPSAFKAAAQSLGSSVRSSMTDIGSGLRGLRNAQLEKAAASEPACKQLGP